MPEGTTTFLCPQSAPMGGFARTSPSYETPYTPDAPVGENGWGNGYSFPCLFRNGDNGWTLISETELPEITVPLIFPVGKDRYIRYLIHITASRTVSVLRRRLLPFRLYSMAHYNRGQHSGAYSRDYNRL